MLIDGSMETTGDLVKYLEGKNEQNIKEIMKVATGEDLYAKISVLSNTVFFISLRKLLQQSCMKRS